MIRTLSPGPPGDRLTGNLTAFSANPLAFLTESARRYGDVVSLGTANVLLTNPDDIERVLVDREGDFVKIAPHMRLRGRVQGFPRAMMNSDGAQWRAKRERIQPAFGRHLVETTVDTVRHEAERVIGGWRPGERQDLHGEIARVTLRAVTRLMFGAVLNEREMAVVARLLAGIMDLSVSPVALPSWMPTPATVRIHRASEALDRILARIAADPGGRDRQHAPVLHALLTGDPTPGPQELRDELATLIMSGSETTTDAVVWTCCLLARHPEVARRVAAEADAAFGDRADGPVPPGSLTYTNAVVREALRLYPPAWVTGREAVREVRFRGYAIPAGTSVAVSQWVTHRDPRFHSRPTEFLPDRWLGGYARGLPRGAYFPFGLGARACIGASVAMTETAVILAAIWRRYRLVLPEGLDIRPRPALALQPVGATARIMSRDQEPSCGREPSLVAEPPGHDNHPRRRPHHRQRDGKTARDL
jgi:cytochrome P450